MDNTQILLSRRPEGAVSEACFSIRHAALPALESGQVRVRNIYLSCDPYMRGQFGADSKSKTPFALNEPVPARVLGQIDDAGDTELAVGTYVWGFLAWEQFSAVDASTLRVIDPALGPISHAISVLGMPGLTAYVGVHTIGKPQVDEVVFVSAGSGAVGQVAGQLALLAGARVYASAGSDAKVQHLTQTLGFTGAFNYKTVASTSNALQALCPDGIDFYFDNVGGEVLDAVLARLRPGARIAICGQISQYDNGSAGGDPIRHFSALLAARALVKGFSVRDHMHLFDEAVPELAQLLSDGKLKFRDDIVDGIENTPQAFIGMMRGDNIGKRLVRIGPDAL